MAEELGAAEQYTDYCEMAKRCELNAVIIATPMPFHVEQSFSALDRGIHVLCEVPAGISVDNCKALVVACRRSPAVCMMPENNTYIRANTMVRELASRGLFSTPY